MPVFDANVPYPLVHLAAPEDWEQLGSLCRGYLADRDRERLREYFDGSAQAVIVEYEYVDKDYRDTYTNFYAKKFADYPPRTIRLHFFQSPIPAEAMWELEKFSEGYIGAVVVRPTRIATIGRTLLDPQKIKGRTGWMCLANYRVNLLGSELTIRAFPSIRQDSDVTRCAHAACWMVFRYFSERFKYYAEIGPYQLTTLTSDVSFGRLVPSRGLTVRQISEIFTRFGFSTVIYDRDSVARAFGKPELFEQILFSCIDSGLPVVASLAKHSHAIAITGYDQDLSREIAPGVLVDTYGTVRSFIVNDDNHLPYQVLAHPGASVRNHPRSDIKLEDINAIVVPLHEKIHFLAENALVHARAILENKRIGLVASGSELCPSQVVLRCFLATSRSYKRYRKQTIFDKVSAYYVCTPMQRFIWVVEISTRDLVPEGKIIGEIVFDATASALDPCPFFVVHYPKLLITNNRHCLTEDFTCRNVPECVPYDRFTTNLTEVV